MAGYHEHFVRRASDGQRRHLSDDALLVHIKAIHAETRGGYGWPRIWKELLARGIRVGKLRMQKLMQLHGIRAKGKRRFKVTTGLVVSWTIGTRPDANLVNTMLDAATETVATSKNKPVIHSDRGAHYRWPGWLSRVQNAKLIRSMSRKGCSPDNAACEGFFGRLKTELFYPRSWQDITIDQFIQIVDSYIRWYNEKRIKISLGSLSPLEYRASLGLMA